MGADVLDISIHPSKKTYGAFKETGIYSLTDPYLNYDKKLENLKSQSYKLYKFMNDKVYFPLRSNLIMIYDSSSNYISFLIRVVKEHQSQVFNYIHTHYDNVKIAIQDNWMKLDFFKDGKVSTDDLREGMIELYHFMKEYEYLEQAQKIKSEVYLKAIQYIKKEQASPCGQEESNTRENSSNDDLFDAEED